MKATCFLFLNMKQELYKALWHGEPASSFATGGELKVAMPGSLELQDLGIIKLPVSTKDLPRLKSLSEQAPYGFGEQALLDSNVRQAWQIDPSKLSFPDNPEFLTRSSFEIATSALNELGVDAGEFLLEPKLFKMLLHEPGGHFKFQRDTEKEDGMFATLIIQLPTQTGHEGGVLTVRHRDSSKTFDHRSRNGFFYKLFFNDCKHELSKITRGSRVCLVFSLVMKSTSFLSADKPAFFLATRPRVESLLRQWVDSRTQKLMIIPLGHRYSWKSLSFSGLKGHDRVVADLVRRCEFLEVHLCTLTKKVTIGTRYGESWRDFWLENWKRIDDSNVDLGRWWCADSESKSERISSFGCEDVLRLSDRHNPFHGDPDDSNEYRLEELFYHLGALVVWASSRRIEVLCSCFRNGDLPGKKSERVVDAAVANILMEKHLTGEGLETPEARSELRELIEFSIELKRDGAWRLLFTWACKAGLRDEALKLLKLQSNPNDRRYDSELVQLLPMFNWEELKSTCGNHILEAVDLLTKFKSAGRDGDALELARLMVSKMWKVSDERKMDELLAFCLSESSLESEAVKLAEKAHLWHLGLVFHRGGEGPRAIVNKRLNAVDSPRELMHQAELVLNLETRGAHDTAVELSSRVRTLGLGISIDSLKKEFPRMNPLFLYPFLDRSRAEALLSTPVVPRNRELVSMLMKMRDAAGLLRLKLDEQATAAFAELCMYVISRVSTGTIIVKVSGALRCVLQIDQAEYAAQVEYEPLGKEADMRRLRDAESIFDVIKDLLEVVFWFGDEELIERMVSLLKDRPHLAWKLLRRESGFVLRAMSLGDSARRGLKRVAEVRLGYLVSGVEYGNRMISGLDECGKRQKAAHMRNVCGIATEKLIDDPRMLRVLESLREEEWGRRGAAEVNDLEFILSFAS